MEIEIEKMFSTAFLERNKLQEDEYPDKHGLPMCKKCKTERYCVIGEGSDKKIFRVRCKCQQEELERQQEEERVRENIRRFKENQKLSMLGKKYLDARFESAVITQHNAEAYSKCKNYAKNAKDVLSQGIGLYVYGDNSSGKSHLLACLCNSLVAQGYSCIYTSVPCMLAEIQRSYSDDAALGQAKLVTLLENKSFVFIDDLGKEFLGRENNSGSAKFAEKVLLEVLNARYNNGKPTIFSSNYSIPELARTFLLDKAIIERINEMSTRVIQLEGDDFRSVELKKKSEAAKKLGI